MEKLRLGLEWFMNPDHLPFMVGLEKGIFQDAGIDLDITEPEDHFDPLDEIQDGRLDVAITEPIHLGQDRLKGEDAVGIARFFHAAGGAMYNKKSGIRRPKDLVGKRIQYPSAPGDGGAIMAKTMVEADSGTCTLDDFTRVNNGFYHTEALEKNVADAAFLVFRNIEVIEARHKGLDVDYFPMAEWGMPDVGQLIFVTTPEQIEKKGDLLRTFIRAVHQAVDFIFDQPEEAKAVYFRYMKKNALDELENKMLDATMPCFTYDFTMSDDYYENLQHWLYETGQADHKIDPATYWTNELIFAKRETT